MKNIYTFLIALMILASYTMNAQVAVTTDGSTADPSAMLDVKSTAKGLLMPRLNTSEMNAIGSPATGLMVFNTTVNDVYFYNGTSWTEIGNAFATPAGTLQQYAGTTAPDGYLLCNGSAVSRTTYADLFAVIGTTYGSGDGSTTFNLPNMSGKVAVGRNASETEFDVLGESGGAKTHTLTVAQMPSHNHVQDAHNHQIPFGDKDDLNCSHSNQNPLGDGPGTYWMSNVVSTAQPAIQYTGGGQAHNILQPYIVLNYIIKY